MAPIYRSQLDNYHWGAAAPIFRSQLLDYHWGSVANLTLSWAWKERLLEEMLHLIPSTVSDHGGGIASKANLYKPGWFQWRVRTPHSPCFSCTGGLLFMHKWKEFCRTSFKATHSEEPKSGAENPSICCIIWTLRCTNQEQVCRTGRYTDLAMCRIRTIWQFGCIGMFRSKKKKHIFGTLPCKQKGTILGQEQRGQSSVCLEGLVTMKRSSEASCSEY